MTLAVVKALDTLHLLCSYLHLNACLQDWPESFTMKDELIRVLEQMLSFEPSARPTADHLLLLPLLGSQGMHHAQPSPRLSSLCRVLTCCSA